MASTLIFDFDGTIADSFPLIVELFYELTGQPAITDEQRINRLRQLSLRQVLKELDVPLVRMPMLLIRGKALMQQRIDEVKPFPGIKKALEALRDDGHRLFILSSNSEANIRIFLQKERLADYFEHIQGGAGVLHKARALKKIIHKYNLDPAQSFYIGDEVRDIVAAHKVDVRIVSVAWGFNGREALAAYEPFALLYRPAELVDLFCPKQV